MFGSKAILQTVSKALVSAVSHGFAYFGGRSSGKHLANRKLAEKQLERHQESEDIHEDVAAMSNRELNRKLRKYERKH